MSKLFLTCILLHFLLGCDPQPAPYHELPTDKYSLHQKKIVRLTEALKENRYSAANDLVKKEIKQLYLDSIKSLLVDSFHYVFQNFKVTVNDIDVVDFGDKKAFIAKFYDNDGSGVQSVTTNEYWMEFDYPQDSIKSMQSSPAYRLLKGIAKNSDTTLSFFYLGESEINPSTHQLRLRVIPFPKDYNFDSSRKANNPKKARK